MLYRSLFILVVAALTSLQGCSYTRQPGATEAGSEVGGTGDVRFTHEPLGANKHLITVTSSWNMETEGSIAQRVLSSLTNSPQKHAQALSSSSMTQNRQNNCWRLHEAHKDIRLHMQGLTHHFTETCAKKPRSTVNINVSHYLTGIYKRNGCRRFNASVVPNCLWRRSFIAYRQLSETWQPHGIAG